MQPAKRTPQESIRLKKQRLVRNEIWEAAIELFYTDGFDNVVVDQIASHAGVSRRTFFRYFSSKEDVLASMMRNFGTALVDAILADKTSPTAFEAAESAVACVLVPAVRVEVTRRVLEIAKQSEAASVAQHLQRSAIEERLAKAYAARAGRKQVSLGDRILATITLSSVHLSIEAWAMQPKRPIAPIIDEVFRKIVEIQRI